MSGSQRPLRSEAAILLAAVIYGSTFAITQDGLDDLSAIGFLMIRFTVGAVALAPFAIVRARRRGVRAGNGVRERNGASPRPSPETRALAVAAVVFGVVGFAAFAFQNAGLERTSTSNSAFITGLYVVVAPLIQTAADRRRPPPNVLVAIAGSVVGLFLLTGADVSLGRGDALTLFGAVMFGTWIFLAGRYSRYDAVVLTALQMTVFVVLSLPFVVAQGVGSLTGSALAACVYTGLVASAGAFTLQLWGQRAVSPARTGVILLLEPVVAGVVGYAIGERLGISGYAGALVILAAIVVAESGAWRAPTARLAVPSDIAERDVSGRLTGGTRRPTIAGDREGNR